MFKKFVETIEDFIMPRENKKVTKQASKEEQKKEEELLESEDDADDSFASYAPKVPRKDGSPKENSKDGTSLSGKSTASSGSKYGKFVKG